MSRFMLLVTRAFSFPKLLSFGHLGSAPLLCRRNSDSRLSAEIRQEILKLNSLVLVNRVLQSSNNFVLLIEGSSLIAGFPKIREIRIIRVNPRFRRFEKGAKLIDG